MGINGDTPLSGASRRNVKNRKIVKLGDMERLGNVVSIEKLGVPFCGLAKFGLSVGVGADEVIAHKPGFSPTATPNEQSTRFRHKVP